MSDDYYDDGDYGDYDPDGCEDCGGPRACSVCGQHFCADECGACGGGCRCYCSCPTMRTDDGEVVWL